MGSALSNIEEFKELFQTLTQRSHPLCLCVIVNKNDHDLTSKLLDLIATIENKYVNKKNKYALVRPNTTDSQLTSFIDFCEYNNFVNQINSINDANFKNHASLNSQTPIPDLYKPAYLNLTWKSGIKLILDINSAPKNRDNSSYRTRLVDNYSISIYEIDFPIQLELLGYNLSKIGVKQVVEKYVALYKFTTPYNQKQEIQFTKGRKITLKTDILSQEYLRYIDEVKLTDIESIKDKITKIFWIEDVPFAQGKEVFCFKGRFAGDKTKYVFKLAKFKEINLMHNLFAQTIAGYLAKIFTKEIGEKIKVEYSEAFLVEVKVGNDLRTYLVEKFLDGEFCKFTSNEYLLQSASQYSDEEKKLIEFSHWSHDWTGKNLMVVDLQGFRRSVRVGESGGSRFCLTDPAIHSRKSQFGTTDLGSNGFGRFYLFHKCCINELLKYDTNSTIEGITSMKNLKLDPTPNDCTPLLITSSNDGNDSGMRVELNKEDYKKLCLIGTKRKIDESNSLVNSSTHENDTKKPKRLTNSDEINDQNLNRSENTSRSVRNNGSTDLSYLNEWKKQPASLEIKKTDPITGINEQVLKDFEDFIDEVLEKFDRLITTVKKIDPINSNDSNNIIDSREKLFEIRKSVEFESLKIDVKTVNMHLCDNYRRIFNKYKNKIVEYNKSMQYRYVTAIMEINSLLNSMITLIMKLYEIFEEYLCLYRHEIIFYINDHLKFDFEDKTSVRKCKHFVHIHGQNQDDEIFKYRF